MVEVEGGRYWKASRIDHVGWPWIIWLIFAQLYLALWSQHKCSMIALWLFVQGDVRPPLFSSPTQKGLEPVSSSPYSEYFNLHYSGNFEWILFFFLGPRIWGEIGGIFIKARLSLRTKAPLIPLSRCNWFDSASSLSIWACEQPDDLWLSCCLPNY